MLPKKVIIVRHGQSFGNVDHSNYTHTPDWKIELTDEGRKQAKLAGNQLMELIDYDKPVSFYNSPWIRARQTANIILNVLHQNPLFKPTFSTEDPRLQEQNYGGRLNDLDQTQSEKIEADRAHYGKFWYRLSNGENFSDVFNRIANFWTDKKLDWLLNPKTQVETLVLICHGGTARILQGYLMGLSTQDMSDLRNPDNCEIIELKYNGTRYVR